MEYPAIVIDIGTGITKIGFAGDYYPVKVPTAIAFDWSSTSGLYQIEEYLASCFKTLNCEPEDHYILLPIASLMPREQKKILAEIFFECFNVAGFSFCSQSSCSLAASWCSKQITQKDRSLTGLVIESGEQFTNVVPVVAGEVVPETVSTFPIAGREITQYIQKILEEREGLKASSYAQHIKETYCYACPNVQLEYDKYKANPEVCIKLFENHSVTFNVAHERFLATNLYFSPELFNPEFKTPLPEVLRNSLQHFEPSTQAQLCKNIILAGGSMKFKDMNRRIARDLRGIVGTNMEINVITHHMLDTSSWFGTSMMGSTPEFLELVPLSRREYEEGRIIVNPLSNITRFEKLN